MEQILLALFVFVGALVALGQTAHHPHPSAHDKLYTPPRQTTLQAVSAPRLTEKREDIATG
jgi:hypothetical protein